MISENKMKVYRILTTVFGVLNVMVSFIILVGINFLLLVNLIGFNVFHTKGSSLSGLEKAAMTGTSVIFLALIFNLLQLLIMTVLNFIVSFQLIAGAVKNNKKYFRTWFIIYPIFWVSLMLNLCMVYVLSSLFGISMVHLSDKIIVGSIATYISIEHFTIKRFLSALTIGKSNEMNETKSMFVKLRNFSKFWTGLWMEFFEEILS